MNKPTKSGFYVVGEGQDATGKSTHIKLLAEYLQNEYDLEVYVVREPGGSPIADEIRKIIKDGSLERDAITNLLLLTASRHHMWFDKAMSVLERGGVVLSDRNYLSSEIYQGLGEELGVQYVRDVTRAFMNDRYMNPDLTVIFKMDDNLRQKLMKNRGKLDKPDAFESKDSDFQDRLIEGYKDIASQRNYPVIDAGQSIEAAQAEFRKLVVKSIIAKGTSCPSCRSPERHNS